MQKLVFVSIISLLLITGTCFADAVIGPELQKVLDHQSQRGETVSVMVVLQQEINANEVIDNAGIRGDNKQAILEAMAQECNARQSIVKQLCVSLNAQNVHGFTLANAISMEVSVDAIRELAAQADIHSIVLDTPQIMINPIQEAPARSLWGLDHIRSKQANQNGVTGEGVTVAVVDTGIDTDHPAFKSGQIKTDLCTSFVSGEPTVEDGNGHGTHCAGTIGSKDYGVAPGVSLIGVKVLSASGSGTWAAVTEGVEYAAKNADIVSMSLGGTASASGNTVETAVKNAIAAGTTIVIAAGNSGPWARTIGTPGVVTEAITVGAIDSSASLASFSSRGPTVYGDVKPDICAPGVGVLSAWKNGGTNTISGTSMATPHVAGLTALVLAKAKGQKPAGVKNVLMSSGKGTKQDNQYGQGCVDCVDALSKLPTFLGDNRWEFNIDVETGADGSVVKKGSAWIPFAITVNNVRITADFAHAKALLNGQTLWDGPVKKDQKYPQSIKVNAGNIDYDISANGGPVSGKVKVTIYF